jgi:hypothetical protein
VLHASHVNFEWNWNRLHLREAEETGFEKLGLQSSKKIRTKTKLKICIKVKL